MLYLHACLFQLHTEGETGIPSTICYVCRRQLLRIYTFKHVAYKSNTIIGNLLRKGSKVRMFLCIVLIVIHKPIFRRHFLKLAIIVPVTLIGLRESMEAWQHPAVMLAWQSNRERYPDYSHVVSFALTY